MFDVFSDEIDLLIKDGLANLYWFKGDLHSAWLRSGIPQEMINEVKRLKDEEGKELTKRAQMDALYIKLRSGEYNRRLEASRNFARILIEQEMFTPQDGRHQVQKAQFAALRLRELHNKQNKIQETKKSKREVERNDFNESYENEINRLRDRFYVATRLPPQERGYELERIFSELMRISNVQVEEPFRIVGEQIDGAIKYEGRFYIIELKWTTAKTESGEVYKFYSKVIGKMDARGIIISMSGFSQEAIKSLPHGKELAIMLADGIHFTNVLNGTYSFKQLLDHSIKSISLKGEIYISHDLK